MGGRAPAQDYYWFGWTDIPANMMREGVKDGILKESRSRQEKKCLICHAAASMKAMKQDYQNQDKNLDMLCDEIDKANVPELKQAKEEMGKEENAFMKSL